MTARKDAATLTVRPFRKLSTADTEALDAEGAALLAFIATDAGTHDIRYE
jgi:hypothetical protein